MAGHEGQRLKGARPEFEEGSAQQVKGDTGVERVRVQGSVQPGFSLADACVGLHASGGSGGHLGFRATLCSSGTHMTLARGSCGS